MNNSLNSAVRHWLRTTFLTFVPGIFAGLRSHGGRLLLALLFMPLALARADVSLTLSIGHGYDFFYPSVGLSASNPNPVTYDRVESPNGIIWQNFGTNSDSNPLFATNSLDALLAECNGTWKLYLNKEDSSEQLYHFTVSITGVTTNLLGDVTIFFPAGGSSGVTNQPTFYWTGPSNLPQLNVSANHDNTPGNSYSETLPGTATNWTPSGPLTPGDNYFLPIYSSNNFPGFSFTAPTNSSGTLSGWTAEGDVFTYIHSFFSVMTNASGGGGGHTNVAHYTFEDYSDIYHLGLDSSPNDNNFITYSFWGQVHTNSSDAIEGGSAVEFFGTSSMKAYDQVLTNLSDVLAGSFTFSTWVKTTVTNGADDNDAFDGGVVFWADNDENGNTNDTIPISITGSKAAFTTRDHDGNSDTLHSLTSVNDGNYHLITVTRNQASGEKKIYVDGQFETSEIGTTDPLNGNNYDVHIGGASYILNSTVTVTNYASYSGLLDDFQIYSGVLSASEVQQLYNNPGTAIPDTTGSSGDGGLIAHYDFDEGTALAADVSGNGNDLVYAGSFTGSGPDTDSDHVGASGGSVYFDGGSFLSAPASLLPTLAGSFSISFWVKTTQDNGDSGDLAWTGDAIISADIPDSGANDLIPAALTGGQIAFNTANTENDYDDTINSTATVNDDEWHHVVVSRNQPTGEKFIYIDGVLDTSDTDATTLLNDPQLLTIGCKSDASDADPTSPSYNGSKGYEGLLDDIQIYARVLSPGEVTFLYDNPGSVIAGGNDFNTALNTTNLTWTTGGDGPWFTQTSVTQDGLAARSGAITDDQSNYLETTVPTDGDVSFYWKVSSETNWDYLTFYINDGEMGKISGEQDWYQESYQVSAGDVLRWEYSKDHSNSEGWDAGFLDQVSFVAAPPDTSPVITFQPIDQTNYPGYPVNFVADATSNPEANWQWYKVDSGLIPGATSRYYSPTNFGTADVAGSYYAIADNGTGSATTRTASVTFVSAALPPDWTKAFQTQLFGNFDNPRTNYGIATLVDASGNVYAANSFSGTNYFASATFISGGGTFSSGLFKHSATGTALWGQAITNNGSGNSYPQCLAHAPGDGVYMSGVYYGTNSIGTNILQETAVSTIYLARFDAAGKILWVRTFGGTNSQYHSYHQLVADPAGNVTISALGDGPVDFGTTNLVVDGQKGVLAQYDADGNIRWVAKPSGWVQYITYAAGRIYACLGGNETNYIGGLTNTSDRKFVLAALNATNGQAFWLQGVGSSTDNGNSSGVTDDLPIVSVSSSNVFLTGTAWGPGADFGSVSVSWPETNRQYFARFDTNGNAELAVSFGGTNVWPWAAAADAAGNVYVTGDFNGYASFGDKTIGAARYGGIGDAFYGQTFLAKFDRDGNSLWVRQAQSETPDSFVNVRDIGLASDSVWICGFVNDYGDFGTNLANRVYGPSVLIGSPIGYLYYYTGGYLAKITDGVAVALPVTLLNPQNNGTDFQFSFQSQSGFAHRILYRTNLATGFWQTNSTVTGDGSITNISLPFSLFSPASQGFIRVSTE